MNLINSVLKKGFVIVILLIVGITMSFGVMTDEVSAASKKPAKVKITSIQSYDYNAVKITWKKAKNTKKYQSISTPIPANGQRTDFLLNNNKYNNCS